MGRGLPTPVKRLIKTLVWNGLRPDHVRCSPSRRIMYLHRPDPRAKMMWICRGNLNPPGLAAWQAVLSLRRWDVVVDVGANHGETVLNVELPARARVFAFEPNPALHRVLARSCRANGVAIEVLGQAVGAQEGSVALHIDEGWSGSSSVVTPSGTPGARPIQVAQVALADFLARAGVASGGTSLAVKIDVEGYEPEVLKGLAPTISRWADLAILIEIIHLSDTARRALREAFDLYRHDPGRGFEPWPDHDDDRSPMDAILVRRGDGARLFGSGEGDPQS